MERGRNMMAASRTGQNRTAPHWAAVRQEPSGQFSAQVVGLPELRATAATREAALQQVRTLLDDWIASGQLVPLEATGANRLLNFPGHLDPNNLLEQEFLKELARRRQEDLERTLREYDQQCPSSSSTPTT